MRARFVAQHTPETRTCGSGCDQRLPPARTTTRCSGPTVSPRAVHFQCPRPETSTFLACSQLASALPRARTSHVLTRPKFRLSPRRLHLRARGCLPTLPASVQCRRSAHLSAASLFRARRTEVEVGRAFTVLIPARCRVTSDYSRSRLGQAEPHEPDVSVQASASYTCISMTQLFSGVPT